MFFRYRALWGNITIKQKYDSTTSIPKSFELSTKEGNVWVHQNATKHLVEYSERRITHGKKMIEQELLSSMHGAVSEATNKGLIFDKKTVVGNWEFIFAKPGWTGPLPVIKHAVYMP